MWFVTPLSRIHLSLRSLFLSFMLWAHAFHGSTEEFSQWWESHILSICLLFLFKSLGVLFRWMKIIKACFRPWSFRISELAPVALRSAYCHKPRPVPTPDFLSSAPTAVLSGEINCYRCPCVVGPQLGVSKLLITGFSWKSLWKVIFKIPEFFFGLRETRETQKDHEDD